MIAFLTIIYIVVVVLIFKVFKVKPRPWPIALMVVVGVVGLGAIIVLWTIAAPMSGRTVVTRYVVQIVPYVKGQVISIPAQPNVPLKKGDVLYKVDPAPYQYTVDQVTAQLGRGEEQCAANGGGRARGGGLNWSRPSRRGFH